MPTSVLSLPRAGLCTQKSQIPLEHVDVRAQITGAHTRVTCTQRYRNQESQPVEAVYVFPLDERAAVCGFAAVVAGVRYEGVVKPREAAFAAFDDAIAAGHGAFLLDEERPDVFRASIGNLAPGAEVQIELTYVAELPIDDDSIRFTLPTTVSPRYAPREDRVGIGMPPAEILNPPRLPNVPYGLSFTARVAAQASIRGIESPSHPISVVLDDAGATVTLAQQQTALDRDLVLVVTPREALRSQLVLEQTSSGRIAAALTIRPTFTATRAPADVVFVVDRSGSMQGTSIEEVRNALQICLRSLESGCSFNIVGFGDAFESLFRECRPYDERSLAKASSYVASLEANLGGTQLLPALESVLDEAKGRERVMQVVVMTDGQVTNSDAVIAKVASCRDRVRVFTFGIGRGASHHLVNGLARAGGGAAEFVYPGERLEAKIVRLFRRALSPASTEVQVDWGGLSVTTVPAHIGSVFADEPLRVYGFMDECRDGAVTLRARGAAGPLSWSIAVRSADVTRGATVGVLAARAKIREIEDSGAWSAERGSRQRERRQEHTVSEIVRLATEFGLSSRETSWVVVEKREVPMTEDATLRRVPIAITNGWGGRDDFMEGQFGYAVGVAHASASRKSSRLLGGGDTESLSAPLLLDRRVSVGSSAAGGGVFKGAFKWLRRPAAATSSTRVVDRLVALQRADGSWELDQALADVLGMPLKSLVAATQGATGKQDEVRRAWATSLALTFLDNHAASNRTEWELLAAKARRWLASVTALPPRGGTWIDHAGSLSI
jgi:Ca-activated chloride channel family protein